uniref:Peroxidase n=1 Tax=Rhizophora mucronata TaxID=61149 RepID=A0A2P2IU35_RHIMU
MKINFAFYCNHTSSIDNSAFESHFTIFTDLNISKLHH